MSAVDPNGPLARHGTGGGPGQRRRRRQTDLEALRATLGPPLAPDRGHGVVAPRARAEDDVHGQRPFCYRCHKAAVVCLCDRIRVVSNRTGIVIFQHPRERFHALGTARIAHLGLERCEVLTARETSEGITSPFDPPPRTGVLYPGTGSAPLEETPRQELPEHLVVLDGTWSQAHALYRRSAWLRELPHYELNPAQPSRYRLRKEPNPQCISTIEAIVAALRIIEPKTAGFSQLLGVFDSMIDDQIRYML